MTRGKRARLQNKGAGARKTARERVAIDGACTIGERDREAVLVTDLGATGCRMRTGAVGVTKTERLQLWFGEFGPVAGSLKWNKGGAFGVLFDTPLDEGTLEALLEAGEPPSNVVPLRA